MKLTLVAPTLILPATLVVKKYDANTKQLKFVDSDATVDVADEDEAAIDALLGRSVTITSSGMGDAEGRPVEVTLTAAPAATAPETADKPAKAKPAASTSSTAGSGGRTGSMTKFTPQF